jgi:DnaJ-class molecular chaperone
VPDHNSRVDYYEVLQVHPRASTAVIKAAYRVIQRELRAHPDLGGREDFAKLLNEAYRVLTSPDLRLAYDGERLLAKGADRGRDGGLEQVIGCPRCSTANPVPLGADPAAEHCFSCGAPLQRAPRPDKPTAEENIFGLSAEHYRRLSQQSQLDLRAEHVEPGDLVRCRFCGNEWEAARPGRPVRTCPVCAREDWHAYRVLKCRVCGHEWRSARLSNWAYRDHPRCPNCTNPRWNTYCESHPLRWFLGFLNR